MRAQREPKFFSFQDGHKRYHWLLASPAERITAGVFDLLFTAILAAPAGWLLYTRLGKDWFELPFEDIAAYAAGSVPLMSGMTLFAVYLLFQLWLLCRQGQTWGKWLMGIRVVRADGKIAGFMHTVLLRSLVFLLLCVIILGALLKLLTLADNFAVYELLWIPYLVSFTMLFNIHDNSSTLQDKLAGTAVVKQKMEQEA